MTTSSIVPGSTVDRNRQRACQTGCSTGLRLRRTGEHDVGQVDVAVASAANSPTATRVISLLTIASRASVVARNLPAATTYQDQLSDPLLENRGVPGVDPLHLARADIHAHDVMAVPGEAGSAHATHVTKPEALTRSIVDPR